MPNLIDITGKTFGRLTVIGRAPRDGMSVVRWCCECACGKEKIVRGMIKRCESPKNPSYKYYGGRGITICARWADDFLAFLADMGPRPSPQHSIDRINNNGNYEPGNCRWATALEQRANRSDTKRKAA